MSKYSEKKARRLAGNVAQTTYEREADAYADALRQIVAACHKPFSTEARKARKIARDTLAAWGRSVA